MTNRICLLLCLTLFTLLPAQVFSQAERLRKQQVSSESPQTKAQSLRLLNDIEARLKTVNQPTAHQPPVTAESDAFIIVDDTVRGVNYNRTPNVHFLLTRLILINQSPRPLKLVRSQIKAFVDGQETPLRTLPPNLINQPVQLGKRSLRLNSLNFQNDATVPPGEQGSLWILLTDLPGAPHIPKIEFQVTVNDQTLKLNVNRFELGKLKYTIKLLGPSQCLAELTVSGELNSINIGSLIQEIDLLTTQNIKRFVMHFPDPKTQIDDSVEKWLPRAASQVGINAMVNSPFPVFPNMISELHLSGEVFKNSKVPFLGIKKGQVTHETESAAIHAALDSAMSVLTREKVAEQIRTGSPAVKIAALISGGRQLTNAELPLILELTSDPDPLVQQAALFALRYLGDSRVYERLTQVAKTGGPQAEVAVASLAESRFAQGQKVLLKLLKESPPASQKTMIQIIAQSPRPQWGDAIYQFISSDNLELRKAAIQALILNGHPRLFEILSEALQSPNPEIREVAFQELIQQKDNESETLALNYVLSQLKQTAPTQAMLTFLDRLKDQRAIPLLFRHLENPKLDSGLRVAVIKTLASIGDQTVESGFLKVYPQAKVNEKLVILSSLQEVDSPHYYELVEQALNDSDLKIVNGAIDSLRKSGSIEAVNLLQKTLRKTDQSSTWRAIYSSLVSIGTPEARRIIMDARFEGDLDDKKRAAATALNNIYTRSPGSQYVKNGNTEQGRKQYEEALEEYQTALSIDSLLVPAYQGIVNVQNAMQKYEEALKTADQGLKIDSMHARLYVAKGMIYSNLSQSEEALQQFHKAIEIDPLDHFSYVMLASHYSKHNQNEKALEAYDGAIHANPRNMDLYDFKADLQLSLKRPDDALKTYDQAIEVNRGQIKAYSSKMTLLRKLHRYYQVLAVCDDILKEGSLKRNPQYVMYAYLTKANTYQQLSQLENAIAACDAAIKIRPGEMQPYLTKAHIYTEAEQWEKALHVYDQMIQDPTIQKDNRLIDAFTGRGHMNLQRMDWQSAQKDFQRAFEIDNKSSQAITGLAICMVYNHQEDKAISFVNEQLKNFKEDGLFHYNVACVYGRALINLKDEKKTPDAQKTIKGYQDTAIQHLSKASDLGFQDVEWMQKDPDLSELQPLPAFKALVQTLEKKTSLLQ
ncbi:HEAT repeat domain-containing protein [Gimesia algae]|uniref:Lipoprotein NlpI n=1 Tax=Gimesia algae TaxID=2527971 RepID=A0A517V6L3_9PLAN|nr:HEAT repeat domain-containing protein [Gimesia algae]QDT88652.1 lipoprotein NlpI [Gimesia algae]